MGYYLQVPFAAVNTLFVEVGIVEVRSHKGDGEKLLLFLFICIVVTTGLGSHRGKEVDQSCHGRFLPRQLVIIIVAIATPWQLLRHETESFAEYLQLFLSVELFFHSS